MLEIGMLVLIGIYLQVVCSRDKKYRKQLLGIAKKKQLRTVKQYIAIDKSKVVSLADYRKKHACDNAG